MLIINNESMLRHIRPSYAPGDIDAIREFLDSRTTFEFPRLENGLFAAARLSTQNQYTGYDNVWVRDNIHVSHAHFVNGRVDIAAKNLETLRAYFQKHSHRFIGIIRGEVDANEPMNRPHIRFNGSTLEENTEKWSHAQNDALGYFCWLFCRLAREGAIPMQRGYWELLALFPLFFQAVGYWQDEDSGHWEEARKIEASSIGAVVAALRELKALMAQECVDSIETACGTLTLRLLNDLMSCGASALSEILPFECRQADPAKQRRYDAALLYLIYPLRVVSQEQSAQILHDVETHLQGEHGIRRYLGDSFWCADYKTLLKPDARTCDVSDSMSSRDSLLKQDQEAQWCIFDPVLSTIYGRLYRKTKNEAYLAKQVRYLNRSLGQLTGPGHDFAEFLCPELYYLDNGRRLPNDVTPLLWTQANLSTALVQMKRSAREANSAIKTVASPSAELVMAS